jgi:hypothetical protein
MGTGDSSVPVEQRKNLVTLTLSPQEDHERRKPSGLRLSFSPQSRTHTKIQLSALGTESHTVRSSDKLHSLAMDVKLSRLLQLLSQLSQGEQRMLPGEAETILFRRKWGGLTGQSIFYGLK